MAQLVAKSDSVKTFVCASAVGFYGHTRPEKVDEQASVGEGQLAGVVKKWEEATEAAKQAGKRVVNVRCGLVIAGRSPLVDLLQLNVRVGGGKLGSGRQHFAWVAIDDVVDIYVRAALDEKLRTGECGRPRHGDECAVHTTVSEGWWRCSVDSGSGSCAEVVAR